MLTSEQDGQPIMLGMSLGGQSASEALQKTLHTEPGNSMTLRDISQPLKAMGEIQKGLEELKAHQSEGEAKLKALQAENEERLRVLQLETEKQNQRIKEKFSFLVEKKEGQTSEKEEGSGPLN
jgi:hypothetical protein